MVKPHNKKRAGGRRASAVLRLLLLGALSGASILTYAAAAASAPGKVLIEDVPHVVQKPDFCGEACVEMYLTKLGHKITQDDVFNVSDTDPALGRGATTREMIVALKELGFKPGTVWNKVKAGSTSEIKKQWEELLSDLKEKIPSIVCMRTGSGSRATEHFRLILGFDPKTSEVIYHEPASVDGAYSRMPLSRFLECWPLKYNDKEWLTIRMRLKAGRIKAPKQQDSFTNADFAQHILDLKKRMPSQGFTIVISPPFVVIGDEHPPMVSARAEKTVKWSTKRLKKMFFAKDPADIYDIWLFRDKRSYMSNAKLLFNDTPTTPFGYASSEHKALVMNIATGGGTLVHEIVHPFVEANFPDCPAWLNEGLGSLYEQSSGKGDKIFGLTNWRLAGLQAAIRKKTVPSFKELTDTSTYEFYQKDKGTNYAQARYLCYYLQEKGLLTKFYHSFVANHETDPTGYKTLCKVLKVEDMDAFKTKWEKYVLSLSFP